MYRKRPFQLVTVAINYPGRREAAVRKFLEEQKASARNLVPAIDGAGGDRRRRSTRTGMAACRIRW